MSPKSNHGLISEGILQSSCVFMVEPTKTEPLPSGWAHLPNKLNNDSLLQTSPEVNRSPTEVLGAAAVITGGGPSCCSPKTLKKKKGDEEQKEGSKYSDHHSTPTTAKKRRLIWTAKLHRIFIEAINIITIRESVPKKILEYMKQNGAPDLTRENVASHLQKYRMYLKRYNSEKEMNSSKKLPPKSVPLNVTKESNFKPSSPPNQTYCTENNNSSSSYSCLTVCSDALTPQSFTLQKTFSDQPVAVLPPLDQTQYLNQNMLQQALFTFSPALQEFPTATATATAPAPAPAMANNNVWDVNGVTAMGFLNPPTTAYWPHLIDYNNGSQENNIWAVQHPQPQPEPIVQAFNEVVDYSLANNIEVVDYSLTNNILQPPSLSDQFSNIEGHGAVPLMGNSGDLSNGLDYSLFGGLDQNHELMGFENNRPVDYDQNNLYYLPHGSNSNAYGSVYPFDPTYEIPPSTMENNMNMVAAQDYQTTFYHGNSVNPMGQPYDAMKMHGRNGLRDW